MNETENIDINSRTVQNILKFRDDRNWKQFHNAKDLAISISLEAAELLEIFQWTGTDISTDGKMDKIEEELADVLIYSVMMADICGLDLNKIILNKIERNNQKYPVEKAFGSREKYTELKKKENKSVK